jgi:hypothetical protein
MGGMGGSPSKKIRSNYDPVSVPSSPMISELEDEGSPFLDPQITKPRINLRLCLDVAELSLPAVESAWPGGHSLRHWAVGT